MKIWFKMFSDARIIKAETVEITDEDTRTHKIFKGLEEICNMFDLANPIWLESNINEFKQSSKTRFGKDNFVEEIEFDYLEMQILEE